MANMPKNLRKKKKEGEREKSSRRRHFELKIITVKITTARIPLDDGRRMCIVHGDDAGKLARKGSPWGKAIREKRRNSKKRREDMRNG